MPVLGMGVGVGVGVSVGVGVGVGVSVSVSVTRTNPTHFPLLMDFQSVFQTVVPGRLELPTSTLSV